MRKLEVRLQTNFRTPSCGYRQLLEVTRILTRNHQDSPPPTASRSAFHALPPAERLR